MYLTASAVFNQDPNISQADCTHVGIVGVFLFSICTILKLSYFQKNILQRVQFLCNSTAPTVFNQNL